MKIIKITESQYKRLVRSKKILSEQVVYKDPKDEMDIHSDMFRILDSVGYGLKTLFKKPLYILKIEEGIVYVDKSEYQQNEIDYIKTEFEKLVRMGISSHDKMLTGSDDLGFDSGVDADYVWPDVEDNDDVADVDDTDSEEESECDCINTETNQRYTYNCDDVPPIECFVTDTDNEDSDTINSVTDDCENCINNLTQRQKNNIDSNINDNNVNDFRWWVNQDSGRLKQVTDEFEECCETKDDPTLNIDGSNNEWVKIAFSVVGQEWINEGKPSKPKEDNDDVADVVDISYCDYGLNSKGEKRNFVPPPNMDIKFYQDILKSIDANVTCQKMLFFYSWRTGESSKSTYNPFATTQPNEVNEGCYYNCLKSGRGYTPVGCRECPSGTLPGVRNYKTYESGLKNTVKTLTNGRYNNVVTKLKNDNITAEEIASEKSELKTWGTGGLVLDILKYNKKIKPTPISKYGDEPKYVLSDIDMNLETPKSTGNYFRKGNNKLYGKKGHTGHDYVAVNNPIVYMKKGKVKYASFDNNSCGGTITIVPDGEDRKAIFCHMSEIYVSTGEPIESGTIIGVSGGGKGQKGAGHSTGHHLHFGMKNRSNGGKFIDPNDYIDDIKIIRD